MVISVRVWLHLLLCLMLILAMTAEILASSVSLHPISTGVCGYFTTVFNKSDCVVEFKDSRVS